MAVLRSTPVESKKGNMTRFDSRRVLEKIRELKNRVKEVKVGIQYLTPLQEEILNLFEIICSRKADYKSIEDYSPPPKVKVHLPVKGKPGEWIEIPSKQQIKEGNKIFIENALKVLSRAEKKYSLKNELEKNIRN